MILRGLIGEAVALVSPDRCATDGCDWVFLGGRVCGVHGDGCSEPVYQCARCGDFDYSHHEGECTLGKGSWLKVSLRTPEGK